MFCNKHNNNFFPIKYKKKDLLLKSPTLILPNGISESKFNFKKYLNFIFPKIFTKKHIVFYRLLLNLDKLFSKNINKLLRFINNGKDKKDKIYKKNVKIIKCLNNDYQEPILKMNLFNNIKFFDKYDNEINIKSIKKNINCKILFYISGIWFKNNTFGLLIYCLQLKKIPKLTRCFILNEEEENKIKININNDKIIKKKICCPNCDEKILLILNNIDIDQIKQIQDNSYNKFIRMHKFGVPLQAIKQKIELEKLNYSIFLNLIQNKQNLFNKNDVNKKEINIKHKKPMLKSKFNFADLLKQKGKLKNVKIKKNKSVKKFQNKFHNNKNILVPTLSDILNTLKSLKPVKS